MRRAQGLDRVVVVAENSGKVYLRQCVMKFKKSGTKVRGLSGTMKSYGLCRLRMDTLVLVWFYASRRQRNVLHSRLLVY